MPGSEEHWKTIPGFPNYEVSDMGRMRSHARGGTRYMRPGRHPKGYMRAALSRDGESHTFAVHRIVLDTFVGPKPAGYECDHINGVRDDNRLENLRWVTPRENSANPISIHRKRYGHWSNRVECMETGEIWSSVSACVRATGISRSAIVNTCAGRRAQMKGRHYRYVDEREVRRGRFSK